MQDFNRIDDRLTSFQQRMQLLIKYIQSKLFDVQLQLKPIVYALQCDQPYAFRAQTTLGIVHGIGFQFDDVDGARIVEHFG